MNHKLSLAMVFAALSVLLAACNTAAGFGKDMSAAGQAMTDKAEHVKNK